MSNERVICVITSINPPTEAMLGWAAVEELIVVPDRKTPMESYTRSDVELLPLSLTHGLDELKHDHYCRKMIGYLEAIARGAQLIIDTDDDTYLYPNHGVLNHVENEQVLVRSDESIFINVFSHRLGRSNIWPRGFPLDEVNAPVKYSIETTNRTDSVSVVQFLINGDTDVDAVQRLVYGVQDVQFPVTSRVDIIRPGNFCPFNSQLTAWRHLAFPLMYLPTTVTFRFTDILRSVVAKRVLDVSGLSMGFADSIGYQIRNVHDFMQDFQSEVPCYLETRKAWDCLDGLEENSIEGNLIECYQRLVVEGICQSDELLFVDSWVTNLGRLAE